MLIYGLGESWMKTKIHIQKTLIATKKHFNKNQLYKPSLNIS